jgi:radical SAM protein with 4Fe4S-binding SPASM domain
MKEKRATASPMSIQLLLSRKCNLACYYCSAGEFGEKEKEPELNTKEWVDVLERLKEIQVFTVDFSGGEIFLREDIFEILAAAKKCSFPKVTITSNGTLINDAAAKKLRRLNFKNIAISLDGNIENHDRIRGGGSFAKTMRGIRHLVSNGIIPEILFTPLKSNYNSLNDLVDILYSLGIRRLSFNKLHPTGKCSKIYKDIMLDCFVDSGPLQEIVNKIRGKKHDFGIDDPPLVYQSFPNMYYEASAAFEEMDRKKLKPCSAGHSSCNITSGGWVIPCSELFDFKGGNIREQDILDIWRNSEVFKGIRDLSDICTDQIPSCKNCNYNVLCNGGCRADAYAVFGDILAPDPFCPYWEK